MAFGKHSAWSLSFIQGGDSDGGHCSGGDNSISMTEPVPNEALNNVLGESKTSANTALHVPVSGRGPLLLVGTDAGLIAWNTTDALTSAGDPWWVFNEENAEDFVQRADLLNESKSAIVNTMEVAGPRQPGGGVEEVTGVWLGTAGGLHLIDLSTFMQMPYSSISSERMYNIERWAEGANDVHSVLSYNGMVVIGSRDGTWCLEGGHTGVLGLYMNQTRVPGLVTSLVTLERDGKNWLFAGISPGRYMNIMPIDPQSVDSDFHV